MVVNVALSLQTIPEPIFTPLPLPKNIIDPFAYFPPQTSFFDTYCTGYEPLRSLLMDKLFTFDEHAQNTIKLYVKRFKSCGEDNMLLAIEKNDIDFILVLSKIGVNLAEIDSKRVFDKVNNAQTFEFLMENGFVFIKSPVITFDPESNESWIMEKLYSSFEEQTLYWSVCGWEILTALLKNKLLQNWEIGDFWLGYEFAEIPEVFELLKEMKAVFPTNRTDMICFRYCLDLCLKLDPQYVIDSIKNRNIHTDFDLKYAFTHAAGLITLDIKLLDEMSSLFSKYYQKSKSTTWDAQTNNAVKMLLWAMKRGCEPNPGILVNLFRISKEHNIQHHYEQIYSYFEFFAKNEFDPFWVDFSLVNHAQYMPELWYFLKTIRIAPSTEVVWNFLPEFEYDETYTFNKGEYKSNPELSILDIRYIRTLLNQGYELPHIDSNIEQLFDDPFLQIIAQYCLKDSIPEVNRECVLRQLTTDEFSELIEGLSKDKELFISQVEYLSFVINVEPSFPFPVNISKKAPPQKLLETVAKKMNVQLKDLISFEEIRKDYFLYLFLLNASTYEKTFMYGDALASGCNPFEALICAGIDRYLWKVNDPIRYPSRLKISKGKIKEFIINRYGSFVDILDSLVVGKHNPLAVLLEHAPDFVQTFIRTLYRPEKGRKKLTLEELEKLFHSLNSDQTLMVVDYLFKNPKVMAWIAKNYLYTTSLIIKKSGRHRNTFYSVLFPLLSKLPITHLNENTTSELHENYRSHKTPTLLKTLDLSNMHFKRLNRTLVEINPHARFLHAFKICKIDEKTEEFCKEFSVTAKCHQLFQSNFHYPVGLYLAEEVRGMPKVLAEHFKDGQALVYHYVADPSYFLYLHDTRKVKEDKFQIGRELVLKDTVDQFLMGVYPFLADMYHNKTTNRPYFALRDLLLWTSTHNNAESGKTQGTGRLEAWENGVRYPNARASGAADMGDAHLLKELLEDPTLLGSDFPHDLSTDEKKICIQMNELAKLMLVDTLILVYRKTKERELNWRDNELCQSLSEELIRAPSVIMQSYLGVSYKQAENFVRKCGVDWILAARQISFWFVPTGEDGYAKWVEKGEVPRKLYNSRMSAAKGIKVVDNSDNFKANRGYTTFRGTHDVGPFNGPWGIVELERAWAILTFMCIGMKEHMQAEQKVQEPPRKRRRVL